MTLRDFPEQADAGQKFASHVWRVVSFGEKYQLTRDEMATILEDIADDLDDSHAASSGQPDSTNHGDLKPDE